MKTANDNYDGLLFEAVLQLRNADECRRFFTDLCTDAELRSMYRRLEVARMLSQKQLYTDIAEKTGASTATISRVNKCLNFGNNGYNLVLKRIGDNENGKL